MSQLKGKVIDLYKNVSDFFPVFKQLLLDIDISIQSDTF